MAKSKLILRRHKPGENAKQSGEDREIGPRDVDTAEERTFTNGNPFPPLHKSTQTYGKVDPTKHKSKPLRVGRSNARKRHVDAACS